MKRKKWQGTACLLLASLMISSVFATPVRKEAPTPQATTMPKATTTPQPVESPKVAPCPKTQVAPQASEVPKATTCPKTTEMPKKEVAPNKPGCKKVHEDMKNAEKQKSFTLDHFKMIINALKKMGVKENQIITYVKEGKKLEDILKAERINTKKFKKCITKEYFKVVDEAVKNGQITAEQSKQLKAAIKETIKNWLPKK